MPPKKQTTVEHILEKEFDMVRQNGYDFLTARKLAGELNCSTQPIYQAYADMNGLKLALIKKSQEVMMEFISENRDITLPVTLANIIGYVEFANIEKHLFQLIFISGGVNHDTVVALVPKETGSKLNMIIYANGIVMMAAYNALNFPWEVVKELIVIQNKLWNFWHTKI